MEFHSEAKRAAETARLNDLAPLTRAVAEFSGFKPMRAGGHFAALEQLDMLLGGHAHGKA